MSDRRRPSWRGANFRYVIQKLGLAGSGGAVFDAGDAASLPGAATEWNDISGNGIHLERGADHTHPGTDEPSINGTAGQLAAGNYLGFDGGDFLTFAAGIPSFLQSWHKDNAIFTAWAWLELGAINQNTAILMNTNATSSIGMRFRVNNTNQLGLLITDGVAGPLFVASGAGLVVSASTPLFVVVSVNEPVGASGGYFRINGATQAFTSTYASPTASDASVNYRIGAAPAGDQLLPNGSKLFGMGLINGAAWSVAQSAAFFQATRGRFGV